MSLDLNKLEAVRDLADGLIQARCPACAEEGHDRTGNHLRIYPDGRYGCCVHPKDGPHRKRIFALAGQKAPGTFTVRVATHQPPTAAKSVKAALTSLGLGTLGTPKRESEETVPSASTFSPPDSGTLGTPLFQSRAYRKVEVESGEKEEKNHAQKLIDSGSAVPSVPSQQAGDAVPQPAVAAQRLPYLMANGTLVIPFSSPERYHWWKGGQSVAATRAELLAQGTGPQTTPTDSPS